MIRTTVEALGRGGRTSCSTSSIWHGVLTDEDVLALDRRAREAGRSTGWDLQFVVAGNPESVGLVAGADQIVVPDPAASPISPSTR